MATATKATKLTVAQRKRLDALDDDARVVGWSRQWRGPIVRFVTGKQFVITRDGGPQAV